MSEGKCVSQAREWEEGGGVSTANTVPEGPLSSPFLTGLNPLLMNIGSS